MALATPRLSVVVTSYSRERLADVRELVLSLAQQTQGGLELVFVAEGDPSLGAEVARAAARAGLEAQVLFNDGEPGASAARNLAIGRARGEVIAFLDDTVVAEADWAERLLACFARHPQAVGVAGLAAPLWQDPSLAWLPPELEWLVSCTGFLDVEEVTPTSHGATVNVAYRGQVFARAGLFRTDLGPKRSLYGRAPRGGEGSEDQEFARRVRAAFGDRILLDPAVRVRRKVYPYQLTAAFIAKRARATGYSRHLLRRLYGSQDRSLGSQQLGLLGRIFVSLLPRVLLLSLRRPGVAWRQLRATVVALVFVGAGYTSSLIHSRGTPPQTPGRPLAPAFPERGGSPS